ncbi:YheT family hydrolase [Fulvivirga sp. M361]|uniref:YheT family hydrolase n=1 Tax=Fulvivirga sp. M361 TaxID=2594266 RepID=UPI002105700F|nr:alpha/beta fold hydrolase [Fulvivirga sp. M361]
MRNGHIATVIPSILREVSDIHYVRERIDTPDDDFLDLDWLTASSGTLAVITHGLEGSSNRPYVLGMGKYLYQNGIDVLAWNCRSCSGEINRQARFYHHGETQDIELVISHALQTRAYKAVVLIGFSMGGSITLKYLGENAHLVPKEVKTGVAISVPTDLRSSADQFEKAHMAFYRKRFLKKLELKVKVKAQLYPDKIEYLDFSKIRAFRHFDNTYTAPLHGFTDANDFYEKASAQNYIPGIRVPFLLINALNDPFLTPQCFPRSLARDHPLFHLEIPDYGGHVGFTRYNSSISYMEMRTYEFAKNML